jgi:hypothetical protein
VDIQLWRNWIHRQLLLASPDGSHAPGTSFLQGGLSLTSRVQVYILEGPHQVQCIVLGSCCCLHSFLSFYTGRLSDCPDFVDNMASVSDDAVLVDRTKERLPPSAADPYIDAIDEIRVAIKHYE